MEEHSSAIEEADQTAVAILEIWQHVFPPFKFMYNNRCLVRKIASPKVHVYNGFKWRKNNVASFQELPLPDGRRYIVSHF